MGLDRDIAHLYPPFRIHVVKLLEDALHDYVTHAIPYRLAINEGFRSMQRQAILYAQGRTAPGKRVTQLLTSLHSTGLACDLVPIDNLGNQLWGSDTRFERIGYYAARHGIEWGGNWRGFRDLPHVEPVHADLVSMLPDAIEWCRKNNLYPDGKIPHFAHIPA